MDAKTLAKKYGLTVKAVFIPWTQSRNFDPKKHAYQLMRGGVMTTMYKYWEGSLNWKVTLMRGERELLTTDYMAGIGHAP